MILKIRNIFSKTLFFEIILIGLLIFIFPTKAKSAELLQITNSKTILVGDQNRSLPIILYCTNIDANEEAYAVKLLKNNFPRGTKVKIKPYGSIDDKLIAKIYKINTQIEMTDLLNDINLSKDKCIE